MSADLFDLTGKTAIVTGSTRGIGRAIALQLRDHGASVIVSSESPEDTAIAAAELGTTGVPCDVSDEVSLSHMVSTVVERFGGIDILVGNAGISGSLGESSLADFDRVMSVNLRSKVRLTELALPHMAGRENANVVLMSSISGLRGNRALNAYSLSKAAVAQLARNIAVQWGPSGVRANSIAPGMIATDMVRSALDDAAFAERRVAQTPLRRFGTPEDVAGAALFLASPAAAFVTGHNLVVDGGTVIGDGS